MKSWFRTKLEWAADMLLQMFMPLFLFYCIAGGFLIRMAKMALHGR
jgi:hypothetical protein